MQFAKHLRGTDVFCTEIRPNLVLSAPVTNYSASFLAWQLIFNAAVRTPLSNIHAMEVAKISDIPSIDELNLKLSLIVTNYQDVFFASLPAL